MKKVLIGAGIVLVIAVMIVLNVVLKGGEEDGATASGGMFGGSKGQPVTVELVSTGDLSSSVLVRKSTARMSYPLPVSR